MELKDLSELLAKGLLKNPLILFLFICGIGYIILEYGIPIIKIIKIEKKQRRKNKK